MASATDLLKGVEFTSQHNFYTIYLRGERAVLAVPATAYASRLILVQRWVCVRVSLDCTKLFLSGRLSQPTVLFEYTKNLQNRGVIAGYSSSKTKVFCFSTDWICYGNLIVGYSHLLYASGAALEAPCFLIAQAGGA